MLDDVDQFSPTPPTSSPRTVLFKPLAPGHLQHPHRQLCMLAYPRRSRAVFTFARARFSPECFSHAERAMLGLLRSGLEPEGVSDIFISSTGLFNLMLGLFGDDGTIFVFLAEADILVPVWQLEAASNVPTRVTGATSVYPTTTATTTPAVTFVVTMAAPNTTTNPAPISRSPAYCLTPTRARPPLQRHSKSPNPTPLSLLFLRPAPWLYSKTPHTLRCPR